MSARSLSAFLIAGGALLATPAMAQDSDGDGVPDSSDAYPCDARVASVSHAPAENVLATLAYEDQWPEFSDLDFNDVVVRYNLVVRRNAASSVSSLRLFVVPVAIGGTLDNGLAWQLPIPASAVSSVRRRVGQGAWQNLPLEGDAQLTVRLSANLRELFGDRAGVINAVAGEPTIAGQPLEVEVELFATSSGINISLGQAPFDLFIFRSGDFGHQIHFPSYAGTAAMRTSLFGTHHDGSTPGRAFVYRDGTPFALNLQTTTSYPREGVAVSAHFPDILGFAASAGAQNQDFFLTNTVSSQGLAAPAASVTALPAADRSCVPVYTYAYSPWGSCSASCNGTQSRQCLRSDGAAVADSHCGSYGLSQSCNPCGEATYSGSSTYWSVPTVNLCGYPARVGHTNMNALCNRLSNGTANTFVSGNTAYMTVPSQHVSGGYGCFSVMPGAGCGTYDCSMPSGGYQVYSSIVCSSYTYAYSAWSACSSTCNGTRTRQCLRSDGASVSDAYCGGQGLSQTCGTSCGSHTYSGSSTYWSVATVNVCGYPARVGSTNVNALCNWLSGGTRPSFVSGTTAYMTVPSQHVSGGYGCFSVMPGAGCGTYDCSMPNGGYTVYSAVTCQ